MEVWEQFLLMQEREIGAETVRKWLRSLQLIRFDACNLYLEARDAFQILWFEEHVRTKVIKYLKNNNSHRVHVHLSLPGAEGTKKGKARIKNAAAKEMVSSFELSFEEWNPICTFENLVVSEANLLVHKILLEVAGQQLAPQLTTHSESQLAVFNPIYIYGQKGTGKTHLLQSVAYALKAAGVKVLYARAETFTDHVVAAIRAGEMSTFRKAYRSSDVLLLDDIHVFSRKGATQEELFHTFNTLHLVGKQIILTSNCAPQELKMIEARLVSRFEWGIVLPLEPLRSEERLMALRVKAKALGVQLSSRAEEYLWKTFPSNIGALCRALEALALRWHMREGSSKESMIQLASAKALLEDLVVEETAHVLQPDQVVRTVAEQFGIRIEDILGRAQSREYALPRQIAMHICRTQLKLPFARIGEVFQRDHTTVMASVTQIQTRIDLSDRDLTADLHAILKKLEQNCAVC